MAFTPERLTGFAPENPIILDPDEEERVDKNRRELIVSGVLWGGLITSVIVAAKADVLDRAYDSLVLTSSVSREVVGHTPFVPSITKAGSGYLGDYVGGKVDIGVTSLLDTTTEQLSFNEDPSDGYVDILFSKEYGTHSVTLEYLAKREIGLGGGEAARFEVIKDPNKWNDRQKNTIKAIESHIADDLKDYRGEHNLSNEEFDQRYDRIFAEVLSKRLGLASPPKAAEVLGTLANALDGGRSLTDGELGKVKTFYQNS